MTTPSIKYMKPTALFVCAALFLIAAFIDFEYTPDWYFGVATVITAGGAVAAALDIIARRRAAAPARPGPRFFPSPAGTMPLGEVIERERNAYRRGRQEGRYVGYREGVAYGIEVGWGLGRTPQVTGYELAEPVAPPPPAQRAPDDSTDGQVPPTNHNGQEGPQ